MSAISPQITSTMRCASVATTAAGPELAWSCYDYADLVLARDSAAHHAQQWLDEAVTLSRELSMQHLTVLVGAAVAH